MSVRFHLCTALALLLATACGGGGGTTTTPGWVLTGAMSNPLADTVAVVLPDGRVLIAGGHLAPTSAELYDPATGTFTPTGDMMFSRGAGHTATLLQDGKVLFVGGINGGDQSAEVYDPATGLFTPTVGQPLFVHKYHQAVRLPSGHVAVLGGRDGVNNRAHEVHETYDPSTGMFTAGNPMATKRNSFIAVLLDSGEVLVAGGPTKTSKP